MRQSRNQYVQIKLEPMASVKLGQPMNFFFFCHTKFSTFQPREDFLFLFKFIKNPIQREEEEEKFFNKSTK
jgi:hypothetical protein